MKKIILLIIAGLFLLGNNVEAKHRRSTIKSNKSNHNSSYRSSKKNSPGSYKIHKSHKRKKR
ncbi:MAG: hypothetical protein Q8880_10030 [Bacteroidota bacterium]|nr:hypothetical protein [Bacteroidota bacterium]